MEGIYLKKLIVLFTVAMLLLVGCEEAPSADTKNQKKTEEIMQEIDRQVGMPRITNYQEKKLAKEIFELRDRSDLITYAYTQNLDGQYVYLGKAIGFGLPYSVQYTNPERIADRSTSYGYITLPQADPNGLFMPDGLSATWLMLINEETGEPEIIYTEPSIVVTQSKLPKRLVTDWSLPKDY
nr:hypothetical protein 5 [Micrococcaceae bacterium]